MLRTLLSSLRQARSAHTLPAAAQAEIARDRVGLPAEDPGSDPVIEASMGWLAVAQDRSASRDGGVARHYSVVSGWATSYPETTGYIVPTMLAYARLRNAAWAAERARHMLDWLVGIQHPEGSFQGGVIGSQPVVPVTFNTGQILLGLAAGTDHFGAPYRAAMRAAGDWLVRTQAGDGSWPDHHSPFARPGDKTYDTHVAWGLLDAARLEPDRGYGEAALANIRWALGKQALNGWFADCCLSDPARPLTHTIGYALRGVVEGHRFFGDGALLAAARKSADGLLGAIGPDGHLPGRLTAHWRPAARWVCLTGSAQIALCLLLLYRLTGAPQYREGGLALNGYVRRTVRLDGPDETRGGVKGSFPVDGDYGRFEYLNWAAKFLIDSCLLEQEVGST